ncbi:hypothetical protein ACHZ98_28250 [Streptomyces sp. MAR4 CNY-716]
MSSDAKPPMLAMRGLAKYFPGVRALQGVELTVHAGEVVALLVPELSVAENVFLGREPRTARGAVDKKAQEARARELLAGPGPAVPPGIAAGEKVEKKQTLGTVEITKANAEDVYATYDMSGKVG